MKFYVAYYRNGNILSGTMLKINSIKLPTIWACRLLLAILILLFAMITYAQAPPTQTATEKPLPTEQELETLSKKAQFQILLNAINEKEKALKKLHNRRQLAIAEDTSELDEDIAKLDERIKDLRVQFSNIATNGHDLTSYIEEPDISINWKKDIAQVAYPLLRELKKVTARARTIEQLTIGIDFLKERRRELNSGLENLKKTISGTTDEQILQEFKKIERQAAKDLRDIEQRISILSYKLNDEINSESPLWESLKDLLGRFAGTMLLHLSFALIAAWLTYKLIRYIAKIPMYFLGKSDSNSRIFAERSVNLGTSVLAWLFAIMMLLVVLYSFSEWAMLGLIVVMLIAILFSLKDVLPQYLVEARALINLGPVRQGERVVYDNIPWKVSRLDVYTRLYNPALNAVIRLPITRLSKLHSRPYHADEPWFPSKTGDYVITESGRYGQIIRQTPEAIQLNHAGAVTSYQTEYFLAQTPTNLSESGFTIFSTFGIDYRYQQEITTKIREKLEDFLLKSLNKSQYHQLSTGIKVEFSCANSSSLDFKVISGFSKGAAPHYYSLRRWLQKTCVDCANKYNWEIPFQQVTLHQASFNLDDI